MRITSDFTGATQKIGWMRNFPRAGLYVLTVWSTKTIRRIVTRGILHAASGGELMRNVGMETHPGPNPQVIIGTGVKGTKSVKYARIQEEGGTIVPVKARALTIPLAGTKGVAANYPGLFLIKTKIGNALLVERTGKEGFRARFLLSKRVRLPAKHWFSIPINEAKPELDAALQPAAFWETAKRIGS